MGSFIDLTGQRFGKLTVIKRGENIGRSPAWICSCDCGNTKTILGQSLRRGMTKSCGCSVHESGVNRIIDLTGQKFGRLTVIKQAGKKNGNIAWECLCDCGNTVVIKGESLKSGTTKSCGCYSTEVKKQIKHIDLIGKKFGKLTVIERAENKGKISMWVCECTCGNRKIVSKKSLMSGSTKTCGRYECSHEIVDLIGQRFGKLVVVDKTHNSKNSTMWRCKCDCGREVITTKWYLQNGTTRSCIYCNTVKKRYTKECLISLLKSYVDKNGYPFNERDNFKSENGLPSATAYKKAFGGNMYNWLELCGYDISDYKKFRENHRSSNQLSKEDCIKIIYSMQEKINRPLMYSDFRYTTKDTLGVADLKKHFGSLNKMKEELGLEIIQENMSAKSLTKEQFDNEVRLIVEHLNNKNIDFITTRQINKLSFCSNYYTLNRDCIKFYQRSLIDILKDKGVTFGERGKGLTHKFEDGEFTTSQFEYLFSNYLRDFGLKYGKEYFRDVKYSEFIPDYTGNMNCDYVVKFQCRTIYIEIAGLLDSYKTWYYKNKPIGRSKSKEKYRLKLAEKQQLLESVNAEYFILFPCDLTKDIFNAIIMTKDSVKLRNDIQRLNKTNIEWDKVRKNGELKYDYSRIGKDKQPTPIY